MTEKRMDAKRRKSASTSTLMDCLPIGDSSYKLVKIEDSEHDNNNTIASGSQSTPKGTISYRILPMNTSSSTSMTTQTTSASSGQPKYVFLTNDNTSHVLLTKTGNEQKRRMMHKEIERRRRDKINDWIDTLSKEVPDCALDRTKQGQSKGGILAKTVNYIQELRSEISRLTKIEKEKEQLSDELDHIREQFVQLEDENKRLTSLLKANDIPLQ